MPIDVFQSSRSPIIFLKPNFATTARIPADPRPIQSRGGTAPDRVFPPPVHHADLGDRILGVTGASEAVEPATERAFHLADQAHGTVTLLHVLDRHAAPVRRAAAGERLNRQALSLSRTWPHATACSGLVEAGDMVATIVDAARRRDATLIAIGHATTHSLSDRWFGSTAERLLRSTDCPVLIARGPADTPYRRILVAVDSRVSASAALTLACRMPGAESVLAVHAYEAGLADLAATVRRAAAHRLAAQHALEDAVAAARARAGNLTVNGLLLDGSPMAALVEAAAGFAPDLVVLLTHARHGLALAIRGSFTDYAIDALPFDMLVQALPHRRALQ